MRAPSVNPEEFENVGGFELPKDFQQVVDKANRLEAVAHMPGWKDLLDELELEADRRLGALREAEHADATVIKGLRDEWKHAEGKIRSLEMIIVQAVNERDAMLQDLAGKYGQSSDEILGEAKVIGAMKAQLHKEGLVAIDPDELFTD